MFKWSYLLILTFIILAGCASTSNQPVFEFDSGDAKGVFVPVRVHINRNVPVARFYESRLIEVKNTLKRSGMFLEVGSHVDSPYVLDLQLERGSNDNAVDTTAQLLSAATLFLLPSKVNGYHILKADLYIDGSLLKSYEYKDEYDETISIYNYNEAASNDGDEFVSIRNVVNKLLKGLDEDDVIERYIDNSNQQDTPKEYDI